MAMAAWLRIPTSSSRMHSCRSGSKLIRICMVAPFILTMSKTIPTRRLSHSSKLTKHSSAPTPITNSLNFPRHSFPSSLSTSSLITSSSSALLSNNNSSNSSSSFSTFSGETNNKNNLNSNNNNNDIINNQNNERSIIPSDFGGSNGPCIINKNTILDDIDNALGLKRPPDLEV